VPWLPLTPDHVTARLAARELATLQSVATREYDDEDGNEVAPTTLEDRLGAIIEQTVERIRGAILSNPRVLELGPAGTIPSFCVWAAAIIARTALLSLPPVEEGMTDPRRDESRAAEKEIETLRTMDPKAFALVDDEASTATFGGAALLDF
jgi:hypothetical protein